MRYLKVIFGLAFLYSCQIVQDTSNIENNRLRTDTISIFYKRYSLPEENPAIFEYKLIREEIGDSLLTFRYYRNTALTREYNFNTGRGRFQLIQENKDSSYLLVVVDTFDINLIGEKIEIHKYEIQFPKMDGDVGYLFNKKYGLIGYSAYSWGSKTILTNWNNINFENEMKKILLTDNVRYLRRQQIIPPPGQYRKHKTVKDTVEIELEEEIK